MQYINKHLTKSIYIYISPSAYPHTACDIPIKCPAELPERAQGPVLNNRSAALLSCADAIGGIIIPEQKSEQKHETSWNPPRLVFVFGDCAQNSENVMKSCSTATVWVTKDGCKNKHNWLTHPHNIKHPHSMIPNMWNLCGFIPYFLPGFLRGCLIWTGNWILEQKQKQIINTITYPPLISREKSPCLIGDLPHSTTGYVLQITPKKNSRWFPAVAPILKCSRISSEVGAAMPLKDWLPHSEVTFLPADVEVEVDTIIW